MSIGLWIVHIPVLVYRLDISPATLGLILLTSSIGAAIAQPLAGWFVARLGSRLATRIFQPLLLLTFPMAILAPNIPLLFFVAFLMGAFGGPLNVAINTQATEVENARGRASMSVFHGWFSVGSLIAAGLGALILRYGFGDGSGAMSIAILMVGVSLWSSTKMLLSDKSTPAARKRLTLPTGAVLGVAILIFFGNAVEAVANNWSGVFLTEIKGASEAAATQGYAFYTSAMATMRFVGGHIVEKIGERTMLMLGGTMIAAGYLIAVFSPTLTLSAIGFLIIGLGAANTFPILIGVSSRIPGVVPSVGVASVATAALFGFLVGPPIVGFISEQFGLSVGIGIMSVFGAFVAIGAMLYRWPAKSET